MEFADGRVASLRRSRAWEILEMAALGDLLAELERARRDRALGATRVIARRA